MQANVRQEVLEGDATSGEARSEGRLLLDEGAPRTLGIVTAKPSDVEADPDRATTNGVIGDVSDVSGMDVIRPPTTSRTARAAGSAGDIEDNLVAGEASHLQVKTSQVGKQGEKPHGQELLPDGRASGHGPLERVCLMLQDAARIPCQSHSNCRSTTSDMLLPPYRI